MGDHSLDVSGENVADPGHQRADFGVNAWIVRLSTALAPRDDTLQLPVAHQRPPRVPLNKKSGFIPFITSQNICSILLQMLTNHPAMLNVLCNCRNT